MKKLFVLLLALAMVGAAFAQDKPALTFGMYSEYYATNFSSDGTTDAFSIYNETYLNYKAKDMGFSATVVSGADFFATPRNYSLYYKLFDGKATIYAGMLRETGDVRLTTFIEGNGFSTRLANVAGGWMLKVNPIDGLVVSAFVPLTGAKTADDFAKIGFGAGYTIKDVAKFVAAYKSDTEELSVGVDVKAVKDLTARVGYKLNTFTDVSTIYATAGYTMDALTFGLDAYYQLDPALYAFEGQVEYAMDPFTFGVKASFDNETTGWFGQDGFALYPYAKMGFSAGDIELGFQLNGDQTWSIPIIFYLSF